MDYLIFGHHYHKFLVGKRYYGRPNLELKDIKNYVTEAKKGLKTRQSYCKNLLEHVEEA